MRAAPRGAFFCLQVHGRRAFFKVQLLHSLDFVADRLERAHGAVRGQAVHDVVEGQGDCVHLLGRGGEVLAQGLVPGDEDDAHMVDELVLLILLDKAVPDIPEAYASLERLLADAHLLAPVFGRDAHHVALREHMVLHELHIPYSSEGLLVVAAYRVDVQQDYARKGRVGAYLAEVRPDEQNLVLGNKGSVGGDAGAVGGGQVAAAELKRRVAREHELVLAVVGPGAAGFVWPRLGGQGAYALGYLAYRAVVELHVRTGCPSACGRGTC